MGFAEITHEVPTPTCNVVASPECRSPANLDPPVACHATCFACGLSVCADPGCSRRRKYRSYGVQRICSDCAVVHELDVPTRKELDREMRARAGCVALRRARSTGTLVALYRGEEAGLDTDEGESPWSTVCEGPDGKSHGAVLIHGTRRAASEWLSHPEEWCPTCMGEDEEDDAG